jgi:hypothetical protein
MAHGEARVQQAGSREGGASHPQLCRQTLAGWASHGAGRAQGEQFLHVPNAPLYDDERSLPESPSPSVLLPWFTVGPGTRAQPRLTDTTLI